VSDPFREPAPADYGRIYAFIRRRTPSAEDAEDATQEVFTRAAQAFHRAGEHARTPTLAWLYTVARNHLIDAARRRATRPETLPLEFLSQELATRDPEYGSEVGRVLKRAYSTLPKTQQDAIRLRLLEGRSFAEVGSALGIDETAAKMRVQRALRAMRQEFEQEGIGP
jgi:RNA polymerase sigma-70 factor (ECF subfamily)